MTVGQGLKDWRERHGLSREHLAARAGCTARTIENWETDKSAPSVVELALMVPLAPGLLEAVGLKKRAS